MASKSNKKINIEVKLLQNLVSETKKMSAALNGFGDKLTKVKTASASMAKQSKQNANSLKSLAGSIIGMSGTIQSGIFKITGLVFAFKLLGSTVKTIITPYTSLLEASIRFETALVGVEKTVKTTAGGLRQLKAELIELTTQIPLNITQIGTIAQLAGQLGVQSRDIAKFTKVIGLLSITTNLSIEEAATGIARLSNIMGESLDNVEDVANVIVHLGNNFATTEREIVQFALRIGSAAKQAGLTTANTLALATALSSVGLRSESAGSGISRTIIRIQEAVLGSTDKLKDFAEISGLEMEEFSELFKKDGVQAITKFLEGLGRLAASGRGTQAVLEELGLSELRLANVLRSLANAQDLTTRAVAAGNAEIKDGNALQVESSVFITSTANQIVLLNNQYAAMKKQMGDNLTPAFKSLVGWLANLIGKFTQLQQEVRALQALQANAATENETKRIAENMLPNMRESLDNLKKDLDEYKSASDVYDEVTEQFLVSAMLSKHQLEDKDLRVRLSAASGLEIPEPETNMRSVRQYYTELEMAFKTFQDNLERNQKKFKFPGATGDPHEDTDTEGGEFTGPMDPTSIAGYLLPEFAIELRIARERQLKATKAERAAALKATKEANRLEEEEFKKNLETQTFLLDEEMRMHNKFTKFLEALAAKQAELDFTQGLSGDALARAKIERERKEAVKTIEAAYASGDRMGSPKAAIAQALDIEEKQLEALLKKTQSTLDQFAEMTSQSMMDAFQTLFFDVISGEFDNMGDLAKSLGQQILNQLFTTLVAAPLTRTIQDKLGVTGTDSKQKGLPAVWNEIFGAFGSSDDTGGGGQSGDSGKNLESAQLDIIEKQKEGELFKRGTDKAAFGLMTKFAGVLGTTAFALASAFGGSGGGVSGIFGMIAKITGLASSVIGNFSGWGGEGTHESASTARTMANLKAFENSGGVPNFGTGGFIRGGAMDSIKASAVNAGVSAFTSGGKAFNGPMFGVFGERGNEIVAKMLPPGSHALGGPGTAGGGGGDTPIELKVAVVDSRAQALNADQIIELTAGDALVGGKLGEAVLQIQVRR